jgi:hypothetical protein
MKQWGINVREDDTSADVYIEYLQLFNIKRPHSAILAQLKEQWSDDFNEPYYRLMFWVGIAKAQWDCGLRGSEIAAEIQKILTTPDFRLASDAKQHARRRADFEQFLRKLATPNPKPRKPKAPPKRKPIFQTGDCVAMLLSDGDYGAGIILDTPPEQDRPGGETFGVNLLGQLYYKSPSKPSSSDFEGRHWLRPTHHNWNGDFHLIIFTAVGFRAQKHKFEVVGKTAIRPDDPLQALQAYTGWDFPDQIIRQVEWDAEHGK